MATEYTAPPVEDTSNFPLGEPTERLESAEAILPYCRKTPKNVKHKKRKKVSIIFYFLIIFQTNFEFPCLICKR